MTCSVGYHHHDLRDVIPFSRIIASMSACDAGCRYCLHALQPDRTGNGYSGRAGRALLRWAAMLRKRCFGGYSSFHKHSAYILANADMPGFSRMDETRLSRIDAGAPRQTDEGFVDRLRKSGLAAHPVCDLRRCFIERDGRGIRRFGSRGCRRLCSPARTVGWMPYRSRLPRFMMRNGTGAASDGFWRCAGWQRQPVGRVPPEICSMTGLGGRSATGSR